MNDRTNVINTTELRWVVSLSTNCLHAADVLRRGHPLANTSLTTAIAEPARRLQEEIHTQGLDETSFWNHLVPLSASIENNTQLVETVLRKALGYNGRAQALVGPLAGRVADVEAAVRRALPELVEQLADRAERLEQHWQQVGAAMLDLIARPIDPRLIVPKADVILVPAVCGGDGVAHLPYNTVRIESVETDPVPQLPEVLRLAWLLAQLNVDLPMFSETIHRDHLPLVASLAMLPASLASGRELRLCDNDPATVRLAVDRWHLTGPPGVDLADVVTSWWNSHLDLQPAWNVSLAALDRMIHDGGL
ncbi:MAG: hypothetical protein JW888_11900 [Pirellulales bacterium]|nr:hypothetical protein [Pirellulales bacterium]